VKVKDLDSKTAEQRLERIRQAGRQQLPLAQENQDAIPLQI
jgi:hypothetical protein